MKKYLPMKKESGLKMNFTFPENEPELVPSIKWHFNYLLFFMQSI